LEGITLNTASPTSAAPSAPTAHLGGKYLTFALGREEYGLEILKVREIIGLMEITCVPRTLPHIRGVINLRGQVITVVDLRSRFGMPSVETTDETCIIVVEYLQAGRKLNTGIVVDCVSEVLDIPGDKIEPASALVECAGTGFILGLGKVGQSVKILLDIDAVMAGPSVQENTQSCQAA